MDFDRFRVLTFDCYGTLVDWESAILSAMRPLFAQHNVSLDDETILENYAVLEGQIEAGPYLRYRNVLNQVVRHFAARYNFSVTDDEANILAATFDNWLPFPDTVAALRALKQNYALAIISNVDDDLFALTANYLQVPFDHVITAQQVGSYKPSLRNFETAFARIGVPRDQILHVAQSLYHDIAPAKELGVANVWVSRRKGKTASGSATSDQITPDLEVPDMQTLAARLLSR